MERLSFRYGAGDISGGSGGSGGGDGLACGIYVISTSREEGRTAEIGEEPMALTKPFRGGGGEEVGGLDLSGEEAHRQVESSS
ncbi:unnamed protein product [Arabis nemorensis]|uniref:Uncharacterized protein n=1 Tax=Arabis nemorensis TaxID=586526 RepID=A0A565AXK0_9BRAS|nr:unnamed protein product [Arabis nemorensis]